MSDLISRQAAIDALDKIFPADPMRNDYTQGITCGAALATEYIKQLPSAEPKKGRWTPKEQREKQEIFICSECGGWAYSPWIGSRKNPKPNRCNYRYCPHCGAHMEV